jgi:hypothetical protein
MLPKRPLSDASFLNERNARIIAEARKPFERTPRFSFETFFLIVFPLEMLQGSAAA